MESKECPICFEKCFNSWVLNNHLVGKHFEAQMLQEYPLRDMLHGRYPCGVSGCNEVSDSYKKRLIHIGDKHGVFEKYLAEDCIRVEICQREITVDKEYCEYCHKWFSRRERISHDCVQAFEPIILDDIVLLGSEDDSDDDRSLYSNMGDINRIMKDPKDMRKAVIEVCSDEMSEDGERSGVLPVSDGQGDQEMFVCEAVMCSRKFSSRRLRDDHQKMEHKAWEDF